MNIGDVIGPYHVVAKLGEGGMGEVYRARDARLGREVAVKSLPPAALSDPDRVARFEREAQTLAGLNHPHIAALYGLEQSGSSHFLVMELVAGGTLAERLSRGPLPVRTALDVGRQIADALQAAHDRGIIHRDLKPANIAFTSEGHVKVLDFGLAKTYSSVADASTLAAHATQSGMVLGTAAYMSPEQARGLPLDKRSDIFAFGCVLYEMLAGRNPFGGESVSNIIVAILGREPDWTLLPSATPARVQWLLRRCLEKDPRRRLHDIADARIELDEALTRPEDSGAVAQQGLSISGSTSRERIAWTLAAISAAALLAMLSFRGRTAPPAVDAAPAYRATVSLPENVTLPGEDPARFALSPDGRKLAFVAAGPDGKIMLWVRPLDEAIAQPLAGTENALSPFWSSNSQFIGFIERQPDTFGGLQGKLKKVSVAGGQPTTLALMNFGSMSSWSRDDVILFTASGNSPLHQIPGSGGESKPATSLDAAAGDFQHSFPHFLPDGRHFLYSVVGSTKGGPTDARAVYLGTLNSSEPARLMLEGSAIAKYANGYLVFVRDSTLFAQPFDAERFELGGRPIQLAERVLMAGSAGSGGGISAAFSVSDNGVLAYQTSPLTRSELAWYDRSGTRVSTLGDQADYADVVLSPDGSRAAVSVMEPELGTRDIWIFDVVRRLRERYTTNPADDFAPVWSPGGDRLAYSGTRNATVDIYEKTAGGEERMDTTPASIGKFAAHWSPDGQTILYIGGGRIIARSDLMLLPLGERRPKTFLDSEFIETQGRFSPDGRWIAYVCNESRRLEVYVRPYPGPGPAVRVSSDGGMWPHWRRDASELFYVAPDNTLMAAAVDGRASAFQVKGVQPLFKMHPRSRVRLDAYFYDVTSDGQRFLVNTALENQTGAPSITLVVNWPSLLKK